MSRGVRLLPAVALLARAAVGTGCEHFGDTPEQDQVDTDGRIRFTYVALYERDRMLGCLEAAGRDGARLPEPVPGAAAGK